MHFHIGGQCCIPRDLAGAQANHRTKFKGLLVRNTREIIPFRITVPPKLPLDGCPMTANTPRDLGNALTSVMQTCYDLAIMKRKLLMWYCCSSSVLVFSRTQDTERNSTATSCSNPNMVQLILEFRKLQHVGLLYAIIRRSILLPWT